MERGSNYKIGDIITILDIDDVEPDSENQATFTITHINDNIFGHDSTSYDVPSNDLMLRVIGLGDCDEKELFSIRCPSIGNHFDTRDDTFKNAGNIIYMGQLKLQNTNPKDAFSYELKSVDFLNGAFELSLDSNYLAENGISSDIVFGVTFVLLE